VRHEHVIDVHAVEESNGVPYLVMEYISGVSLQDRLDQSGPLELAKILRIGMQTAAGLAAAHAQGLVHRDIKPANILLENGVERVKITDFGLARAGDEAGLTQSGVVAGTPRYMAPEQARGEAVDQRADLFSLGSVLYAMCTGRAPFHGTGALATLKRVCDEEPSAIHDTNPEIPAWLVAIIARLQAKKPCERFAGAAEVADLLGRYLAHVQQPTQIALPTAPGAPGAPVAAPRRYRWRLALAVFVVLLAGLGLAEATGTTSIVASVVGIFRPDGTLVAEHGEKQQEGTPPPAGELRRFELGEDNAGVRCVAFSPDNRHALSGSLDGTVRLWDLEGGKEVKRLKGHTAEIQSVMFSADGRQAISSSWVPDNTVRLWNLESGTEIKRFKGHTGGVPSAVFSPDGRYVLSGSTDTTLRLWDVESGAELRQFAGHADRVNEVAFSPNGQYAVSASGGHFKEGAYLPGSDYTVRLWGVATGREVRRCTGHTDEVLCVAYSPDGRHFLSGSRDKTLRLWDAEDGKELRCFRGHQGRPWSVAFSPDGRRVLSGGGEMDHSVRLWDVEAGIELHRFEGHTRLVAGVAFSPDGRRALSGSTDRTLRLWQLPPPESRPLKNVTHPKTTPVPTVNPALPPRPPLPFLDRLSADTILPAGRLPGLPREVVAVL
jgi:eukaryotic-like serine/threonine-protein kinase